MSAPTYFGSASSPADNGSAADATTQTVTPPASMLAGDLVVLIGHVQDAATTSTAISGTGGGQLWSAAAAVGANDQSFALYWCQFNGTWGANPALVFAALSGTQPVTAIMHVFRPSAVGFWELDSGIAGGAEASASPTVISGITTNLRDSITLAGWGIPNISTWGTLSGSGWAVTGTAQYRNTAGSDQSASFAHYLQAAVGATGNVSKVPSTAAAGASFTIAWRNILQTTIAPNTADATAFGSDATPTLEFTGTNANADDLQYWAEIDTANFALTTVDSYATSNSDGSVWNQTYGGVGIAGQSFTGTAGRLAQAQFYLSRVGETPGYAEARLYAHSGTFGTSSAPTGGALATSAPVDVTALSTAASLVSFDFDGAFTLVAGTKYVIAVSYAGGASAHYIKVHGDGSAPSHAGNAYFNSGASATQDFVFFVYSLPAPLLSKKSYLDSGFANTVTGGDTDPFNSGEKISFTVQAGDALADGTYYWRARARNYLGTNSYSAWSTVRSFTIASSPDVTLALTGVAASGAVGSFGRTLALGLTGVLATGATGTLTPTITYGATLTGVAATGAVGSVVGSRTLGLAGLSSTATAGTLASSRSTGITGIAASGALGSFGVTKSGSVTLTGVLSTGAVGSLSPATARALTGVLGTWAVGSVLPSADVTVALTGVNSATAVGAVISSQTKAITGNAATGAAGSVALSLSTTLTGQAATGAVGAFAFTKSGAVALTGLNGSWAIGSVVAGVPVTVALTGVAGTSAIGSFAFTKSGSIGLSGVAANWGIGYVQGPASLEMKNAAYFFLTQ